MWLGDYSLTRTLAYVSEVNSAKSEGRGVGAMWRKGCRSGPSGLGDSNTLTKSVSVSRLLGCWAYSVEIRAVLTFPGFRLWSGVDSIASGNRSVICRTSTGHFWNSTGSSVTGSRFPLALFFVCSPGFQFLFYVTLFFPNAKISR